MGTALELALKDAGVSPDAIGYINAHGTGTFAGDIAESRATEAVFKRLVPVSSLKATQVTLLEPAVRLKLLLLLI